MHPRAHFAPGPPVSKTEPLPKRALLFYQDWPEKDFRIKGDRHLKRIFRPIYQRLTGKRQVSGFLVWHQLLVRALTEAGCEVRVNDYAFARRHPDEPIALVGYPQILDMWPTWNLPNPVLLGPGLLDHPNIRPDLMRSDSRLRRYIVTCDWIAEVFGRVYGPECCISWHAGIDIQKWSDLSNFPKTVDVLIYDKVRWNRDRYEPELIEKIYVELDRRGLTHETIRYRQYQYPQYRAALERCRTMIFLCEHETQGMAYQEALASNVPILAWDNGFWLDPNRPRFDPEPVPASSVPYFREGESGCGEKFRSAEEFPEALDRFWQRRDSYAPRGYGRCLSFERSALLYRRALAETAAAVAPAS